jgi:hypothetical protein
MVPGGVRELGLAGTHGVHANQQVALEHETQTEPADFPPAGFPPR